MNSAQIIMLCFWILFFLAIIVVSHFSLKAMYREANQVHGEREHFLERARSAKTKAELLDIKSELVDFHRAKCYLRHYGDHSRRVFFFIDGRLSSI